MILARAADTVTWNATLIRADSNGNILSYRQYDYKDYQQFTQTLWTFDITPQNNILMTGYIENYDLASFDTLGNYGWLVQTDSLGCLIPGCSLADTVWQHLAIRPPLSAAPFTLYPNPAQEYVTIKNIPNAFTEIQLRHASGSLLWQGKLSASGTTRLSTESLSAGFYFIRLRDTNRYSSFQKFIRQ